MRTAIAHRAGSDIALPRYDDMCRAISECHRVDDAKDIRDKAESLRAYAKKANNREAEVQFADIKLHAERKCGELLKEMAQNGERASRGRSANSDSVSHLKDLGIDPKESERFQQIAAVPQKQFDAHLAEARRMQQPVTSASVRALTRQPNFTPAQRTEHERLWRVLRALDQISNQDLTPAEWLGKLPDYMVNDVREKLQRARPWLEQFFSEWSKQYD